MGILCGSIHSPSYVGVRGINPPHNPPQIHSLPLTRHLFLYPTHSTFSSLIPSLPITQPQQNPVASQRLSMSVAVTVTGLSAKLGHWVDFVSQVRRLFHSHLCCMAKYSRSTRSSRSSNTTSRARREEQASSNGNNIISVDKHEKLL